MFGVKYPTSHIVFEKIIRLSEKNCFSGNKTDTRLFSRGLAVFVQTVDGLSRMCLSRRDSQHMWEERRRHSDKCRFMYKVKILSDDDMMFEDCEISDNCVVSVTSSKRIHLVVVSMDGQEMSFDVGSHDLLSAVEDRIKHEIRFNRDEHTLYYDGSMLKFDKRLKDYKIKNRSVITISERHCVPFRYPEAKAEHYGNVNRTKTISKMFMISSQGSSEEMMYVFDINIKRVDGTTVKLSVKNNETVSDLKQKIERTTGLLSSEQTLKFNGLILRCDHDNLYKCNINANDTIKVSILSKITINVLTNNMETIRIGILSSDRIIDVKKKIEKETGVPSHEQILSIREDVLSDNNRTVYKCDIGDRNDIFVTTIFEDIKVETRGLCVVISNEDFDMHKKRSGTKVDEENIRTTFEPLGYEVKIHRNVRQESIYTIIMRTKNDVQAVHKMLIIFILSHGCKDGIVFSDETILPIKEVWMPFSNENFPFFGGKPKLFYFVCCRTKADGAGVSFVCDVPTEDRRGSTSKADVFIGYATCKHHVSYRHTLNGTFYVSHFCEVVRNHRFWSVSDIHQEVQSIVYYVDENGKKVSQVPYYENALTKRAYFSD